MPDSLAMSKTGAKADPAAAGTRSEPTVPRRQLSLVSTSLLAMILKGAGVGTAMLSQIVVARCLGVDGFGVYVTVLAWASLLSILASAGLPAAATKFLAIYAEHHDWSQYRGFVRLSIWIQVAIGVAAALGALLAFAWIASLAPMLAAMAVGAPLIVLFAASSLAHNALLVARRSLIAEFLASTLRSVLVTLLVGVAWVVVVWSRGRELTPQQALLLTVLAAIAVLAWQSWTWLSTVRAAGGGVALRDPVATTDRRQWLRAAVGMMISLVAYGLVERLDTILLSAMASPAVVGPYAVASRLSLLVGVVMASISALVLPMAAGLISRHDRTGLQRLMGQGALIGGAAGIVLALAITLLAAPLLRLFGSGFEVGQDQLVMLMIGQSVQVLAGAGGGLLAMAGHVRVLVGIMLATALADLLLCLALIPLFGASGAALATALALGGNGIVMAIAARSLVGVDTSFIAGLRFAAHRLAARA